MITSKDCSFFCNPVALVFVLVSNLEDGAVIALSVAIILSMDAETALNDSARAVHLVFDKFVNFKELSMVAIFQSADNSACYLMRKTRTHSPGRRRDSK